MIAGAEKCLRAGVPNGETEFSAQVVDAVGAPTCVSVKEQFRIAGVRSNLRTRCRHFRAELRAGIDSRIGGDVQLPFGEMGASGSGGYAQGCVAQPRTSIGPNVLRMALERF